MTMCYTYIWQRAGCLIRVSTTVGLVVIDITVRVRIAVTIMAGAEVTSGVGLEV